MSIVRILILSTGEQHKQKEDMTFLDSCISQKVIFTSIYSMLSLSQPSKLVLKSLSNRKYIWLEYKRMNSINFGLCDWWRPFPCTQTCCCVTRHRINDWFIWQHERDRETRDIFFIGQYDPLQSPFTSNVTTLQQALESDR